MIPAERVAATLHGATVDRRPFAPMLSLYGQRYAGVTPSTYYGDSAAYLRGQRGVLETFRPDLLIAPFALSLYAQAYGAELIYLQGQAPNVRKPAFASVDAFLAADLPNLLEQPAIQYLREATRGLIALTGGEVPVGVPLVSPIDLPALLLGLETWLSTVLFERHLIEPVVERLRAPLTAVANAFTADGALCTILPMLLGNPAILPRSIADEFVYPLLSRSIADFCGPVLIHHSGARLLPFVELLIKHLPQIPGVALDHRDDLAKARSTLGEEFLLLGGIHGPALANTTPEATVAACRAVLANRATDPRFLFVTTGADIPLETREVVIQAIGATVREGLS